MLITADRKELVDALLIAEKFSGRQFSLPVVGNILIKAGLQKVKIQSTNLETGIEIAISAKVVKDGSVTVPPRILSALLNTLSNEVITLQESKNSVIVETDSSKTEIRGISASEFPLMPSIKTKVALTVPNQDFFRQVSRVLPAVSQSDFKPEISGLLLKTDGNSLKITGTDTFRLVETRVDNIKNSEDVYCIVPARPIHEFIRLADPESETALQTDGDQMLIETDRIKMITRLISGRYPEYQGLIPKDFTATIRASRKDLLSSLKLAGVLASKLQDIILHYRPNHLNLEIINPEAGSHEREITAQVSGKAGKISFNHRYLSDALEALASEDVTLRVSDETRPALIQDEADQTFFAILMPLRIS